MIKQATTLPVLETSAVPLSVVRPYLKAARSPMYDNIFNKYGSGKPGKPKYRIYIPINGQAKPDTLEAPVPIQQWLQGKGMTVSNYKVGLATLPDGKRQVRLGKVLSDNPSTPVEVLRKMADHEIDFIRTSADQTLFKLGLL